MTERYVVWWSTEGDGSEYLIPIEAADYEVEEAAEDAIQRELDKGYWADEDGLTHGTAVYCMWSIRAEGEECTEWDHFDWFFVAPDDEEMLRELRSQYQMEHLDDHFTFCGVRKEDHDWEDAGVREQVCARCGIRRREVWCEYHTPSYVSFRKVYYDLPTHDWLSENTPPPAEEDEADEE